MQVFQTSKIARAALRRSAILSKKYPNLALTASASSHVTLSDSLPINTLNRNFSTTTTAAAAAEASAESVPQDSKRTHVPSENTVMTNKELEMLRVKGGRMEIQQLNALAMILKHRMTERLPTLLEFQGPQATLNAVKAVTFANSRLKARKKIQNVTDEEFVALEEYINSKSEKDVIKIESDFKYYEKFSEFEGYNIVADLVADFTNAESSTSSESSQPDKTDSTEGQDGAKPPVRDWGADPNRIPFELDGEDRVKAIKEKLTARNIAAKDNKTDSSNIAKHILLAAEKPLVLGIIPSQFRVQDEQGYRFVMRLEPVIIAEPKDHLVKEKCKLIFPPRDRDMLFQSATILRKLWTEHLEQNGPELLCCAAGAESVSRVTKMLECANTLQEKNSGTQFCVRPQIVREKGSGDDGDQLRFHYQFDFYAL